MPSDLCLLPGAERFVRARQQIGALLLQTVELGRDIDIVAIGGKTIGRSPDAAKGIGPVHRGHARASEAGIPLGQLATGKKPNEITAITVLLKQEKVEKVGIKTNRKVCGWDHGYLLTVTGLRDHPQTV